jgi:cytochrome b involved in lipid metabolism
VDYTGFNHPGYAYTINQFRGKDAYDTYVQKDHSFNADLIVCHKTVARLEGSSKESQGHSFYDNIKDSKLNQDHEAILAKFDFSKPLI